jgi:hypothetical protein
MAEGLYDSASMAYAKKPGNFRLAVPSSWSHIDFAVERLLLPPVSKEGDLDPVWCFGPVGHLPLGDVMLAQKLALETDEQATLAVANRSRRRY